MKKAFLILVLTLSIASCSSDDVEVVTENVSISNSETYTYDLGDFGDEDGARIAKQAEHYQISEINRNETIVYTYKPANGYSGSDKVTIEIITGSVDGSAVNVIRIVEIKFTVTD